MNNLKEFLLSEIAEVENDERYHYPPADVWINAPLALEQVALKTKIATLKKVLSQIEDSSHSNAYDYADKVTSKAKFACFDTNRKVGRQKA